MPILGTQRSVNGVFTVRRRSGGILAFLIRQVLTTGYVSAGYKDSIPWQNVNKYVYATDTASNLGNILTEPSNYNKGAHNRNIAFDFGTGGVGAYTSTSCFNMRNDTTYAKNTGMNTPYTQGDNSTVMGMDTAGQYTFSWSNGNQGAAVYQKFNLTTELHLSTPGSSFNQVGSGAGSHFGDGVGYFWADSADSAATDRKKFVFATETESTPASSPGFHGQQKGQVAKTGFGYGGNEGTYGSGRYFRKWNYTTEVNVSSSIQKPVWWCGEENYVMSQTHGISLGNYADTVGGNSTQGQNNDIGKLDFATDSGVKVTSTSLSGTHTTGAVIAGRSSASVHWRD
jgi:hypothetical protein